MRREINLCLHTQSADSKLGKKVAMITRLSRNQKQIKGPLFSRICFNTCWKTYGNLEFDNMHFKIKHFFFSKYAVNRYRHV